MHPLRPRWSVVHWREVLSFSRATLANGALQFAGTRIPHLFIGRQTGPASLGTYTMAEELASMPMTELVDPIGRTLFPAYSKLVNDQSALAGYVLLVNAGVASIALPACMGIALVAAPTVLLALGSQWVESIALIQVLALSACCMAIRSNSWSLYYALGRPSITTRLWMLKVAALAVLIWPLYQRFGVIGVAYADLASTALMLVAEVLTLARCLKVPVRTYLAALARPVTATALMAAVVTTTGAAVFGPVQIPGQALDHAIRLTSLAGLGALTYLATLLGLWHFAGRPAGVEQEILGRAGDWWSARRRAT
jgi:O-antigen/teichoic acid export membrane protein